MKYAEIINEEIKTIHNKLPESWRNISNFFALDSDKLFDLAWSGNPGVRFYEYIETQPEVPVNYLLGPVTYSIDHANHRVVGTYSIQPSSPQTPVVPETISARQIRLWLIKNNISLSSIDDAINSILDENQRNIAKVEWEYAPYIERNHPLIQTVGSYLGLTSEQIDDGFIEASEL